jgi:hypothetical protein
MQRGDIDQMSFAFTLTDEGDDWAVAEDGTVVRTLRADGADQLFDTSVVTYPAYRATDVNMRSALESAVTLGRLPASAVEAITEVAPPAGVGADESSQPKLGEVRADMPSVQLLAHMYECGQQFIEIEDEPDDGPDREAMGRVLAELEALIGVEAQEPNPEDGESMQMASAPSLLKELRARTHVELELAKRRLLDAERKG